MAGVVLDASIAATWCFKEEATEYSDRILSAVSGLVEAVAPRIWAYEIRNSVLSGMRRKRITQTDAEDFLQSLTDLRIRLLDPVSYDDVFQLAGRYNLTFYDAAYLDLAIRQRFSLASLDNKLVQAAGLSGISIFKP